MGFLATVSLSMPSSPNIPTQVVGKPILQRLPTPNLVDRIFSVERDQRLAGYKLPTKGDAFEGVDPDRKLEGYVFATAVPVEGQVGWINEYYLQERANQEDYNYSVDYPYNDSSYPTLTRSYVFLRTDLLLPETLVADPLLVKFEEPDANTFDPVFTDLQLTDHKQVRLDDPILDSLFVGVQRVFEKLPGPVITSYDLNESQQVVAIETQTVANDDVPTPDALTQIDKVDRTGTAKAKVTKGIVDQVFPATDIVVQREDAVIPYKFRTAIPSTQYQEIVEGAVDVPVLQPSDWLAEERQVTLYKKLLNRISRFFTGSIVLVGERKTRDGQIASVTETFTRAQQYLATNDPNLLEGSDVETLGDDYTVKTEIEVDSVFPDSLYRKEIPDVIPLAFRSGAPLTTTELTSAGTAAPPTLGSGELTRQETQVEVGKKRVSVTSRATVSWPTLVDTVVDPETGVAIITYKTIVPAGTTGSGGLTSYVEVQSLDANWSIQLTSSVDVSSVSDNDYEVPAIEQFSLPDTLLSVTVEPNIADSTSFASAGDGSEYSWDGEAIIKIQSGRRGLFEGTTLVKYSIGTVAPTGGLLVNWQMATGTIIIHGGSQGFFAGSDHNSYSSSARTRAITIPNVLTAGISTSGSIGSRGGTYSIEIPPSFPVAVSGSIIYSYRVTRRRFGVLVAEATFINI